jgi:hypothetical protein
MCVSARCGCAGCVERRGEAAGHDHPGRVDRTVYGQGPVHAALVDEVLEGAVGEVDFRVAALQRLRAGQAGDVQPRRASVQRDRPGHGQITGDRDQVDAGRIDRGQDVPVQLDVAFEQQHRTVAVAVEGVGQCLVQALVGVLKRQPLGVG